MALSAIGNSIALRRWARCGREQTQLQKLDMVRALAIRARTNTELYGKLYKDFDDAFLRRMTWEEFRSLPTVTKAHIKASFPDGIVSGRSNTKSLYQIATSGTSDRIMLFQDECKRDWDRAADLHVALQDGFLRPGYCRTVIPADACYERCGADEHGASHTLLSSVRRALSSPRDRMGKSIREMAAVAMRDYFWRSSLLPAFGVNGTATPPQRLDEYIQVLREQPPMVLTGLPMFLFILARHVGKCTTPLAEIIRPFGGKMTEFMRAKIEASFGGRVRENFGTGELGTISHDCVHSRRQHLLGAIFHVEFLRGNKPVGPNELGELVITDLRNHASPLIRYELGDVGSWFDEPCPCGSQDTLFAVHGRLEETIVSPEGNAIRNDQLIDRLLAIPGVAYARVVQRSDDQMLIEAVQKDTTDDRPPATVFEDALAAVMARRVSADVRWVRRIAPEPSGKFKLVQSNTHPRFHQSV